MVPADSDRISRVPPYSGYCSASMSIRIRDSHPLRFNFPEDSTSTNSCLICSPTTPHLPEQMWFGLMRVRSPLLAQSQLFSFPAGTEMFQFPAFAFLNRNDTSSTYRVAPFGYPGVKWLFAPNPGFSQLITSFFASESQGIHRLPFFTCLLLLFILFLFSP